uniref:Serpentine receptor class gamma n=1 Tax=Globodera rostochiensis TaxID=31243 RepID=A0A914HU22_GLORO
MGFVEWSTSIRTPMLYLTICTTIPSMALYIAEIVTILRHKKFHNSFFAFFVMRAIADLLYELDSFYGYRLPSIFGAVLYPVYSKFPNWMFAMYYFLAGHTFQANNLVTIFILLNRLTAIIMPIKHEKLWRKLLPILTIFVFCVPILTCWPVFRMDGIIQMRDPNSTTDRNFIISDAGDAPYTKYIAYIDTVFSAIFMIICVLINICTLIAYKFYVKKVDANWNNNGDEIEKKLLINAMTTFLGHALVASLFLIFIITNNVHGPKTKATLSVYYPVIIDTGTVVLSSWLLLWTSGTLRQQLLKDFGIIRINNVQNIRVDAQERYRNNNNWAIKKQQNESPPEKPENERRRRQVERMRRAQQIYTPNLNEVNLRAKTSQTPESVTEATNNRLLAHDVVKEETAHRDVLAPQRTNCDDWQQTRTF